MEISITFELIIFLLLIAILAGFVDTLAGGGGLIVLPALIVSGLSPLAALGTNKLQGSMGTATSTFVLLKNKKIMWQEIKYLMLASFIGSTIGTIIVQFINVEILHGAIPIALLLIMFYFALSPVPKSNNKTKRVSYRAYQKIIVPAIGGYDGMFGPGTGSFFALAGVLLRAQNLIKATAVAKTLNFAANIAALTVFIIAGQVVWTIGAIMMAGQIIGAWAGAHSLFKINPQYIRFLIVVMCLGMLIKYGLNRGWFYI